MECDEMRKVMHLLSHEDATTTKTKFFHKPFSWNNWYYRCGRCVKKVVVKELGIIKIKICTFVAHT